LESLRLNFRAKVLAAGLIHDCDPQARILASSDLSQEIWMDPVCFMTRVNILGMVGRMDPARVMQQVNMWGMMGTGASLFGVPSDDEEEDQDDEDKDHDDDSTASCTSLVQRWPFSWGGMRNVCPTRSLGSTMGMGVTIS
jgi:hypothetical protein